MKTVLDIVKESYSTTYLEEVMWEEGIIFPQDLSFEAYANPEGKYSDCSNGQSIFFKIGEEMTYGEVLNHLSEFGSVKDDTLTIRLVEEDEDTELEMCSENILTKNGFLD